MPRWTPQPIWKGQDACIIGGGPSLRGFNFEGLKGRNVIGCNDAYKLGHDIVKFTIFGDLGFFQRERHSLEKFGGPVVSCSAGLLPIVCPWLSLMNRAKDGLHPGSVLGWNSSTGAAAINLAISMGATRIFLLGYDCSKAAGYTHWHSETTKVVRDHTYDRFIRGFQTVAQALKQHPGVVVFNVTDGTSKLTAFPMMSFEIFWRFIPLKDRPPCTDCQKRVEAHQGVLV